MSKFYLVSYDLKTPGKDYKALIGALERIGAVRIVRSQWLVRSSLTERQLRDFLMRFMDSNDDVLVVEITEEAMWSLNNCLAPGRRFLKTYLP